MPLLPRDGLLDPGANTPTASTPTQLADGSTTTATDPSLKAVQRVAEARGIPMAHVALAWVLKHPVVSAPIVGATKPRHLPDAIAALDVHLTEDEIRALEEPYGPHQPTAF
jgi:1-deoxyxylulose-5-phosphate synthase